MTSTTSSNNATNRFLEVLNGFSERKTLKRSRAEAIDHFVATASTVLYTSSTPTLTVWNKRTKVAANNNSTVAIETKDKDATDVDNDKNQVTASVQNDNNKDQEVEKDLCKADLQRYQNDLEKQKEELQQIEDTRKDVLQDIVNVWGVYKYGLIKIGALTELSEAPDAIMPGNF